MISFPSLLILPHRSCRLKTRIISIPLPYTFKRLSAIPIFNHHVVANLLASKYPSYPHKSLYSSSNSSQQHPNNDDDGDKSFDLARSMLYSDHVYHERRQLIDQYLGDCLSLAYPPFQSSLQHMSIPTYLDKYTYLESGQRLSQFTPKEEIILSGRIMSKHQMGKRLIFYMIKQYNQDVQIMCALSDHQYSCSSTLNSLDKVTSSTYDLDPIENGERAPSIDHPSAETALDQHFYRYHALLKRGDIISVRGYPYRTKTGQLSLAARSWTLLAPCFHDFPEYNSLNNKELRYRYRHIDLMTTSNIRDLFTVRAKIIQALRQYLDNRGFVEVETPILSLHSGGATARPFVTQTTSPHDHSLNLRIAPELYLKQLIVGGMDRVYEIGKSFRNEGADHTHNPEFTMCEFYQAYSDYEELMTMTEDLLANIARQINEIKRKMNDTHQVVESRNESSPSRLDRSTRNESISILSMDDIDQASAVITIDIPAKGKNPALPNYKIDFSKKFARIDIVQELERQINQLLPPIDHDPQHIQQYKDILDRYKINCTLPLTSVRMFDCLVEHFIESQCLQPTFLCHFPLASSPLAREHRSEHGLTERFELFIARMELVNAYTELNDPKEQRKRFQLQLANQDKMQENEAWFCNVLEWAMPPTAGWGMGIDRLTMLLTNRFSIKEILLFPFMRSIKPSNSPSHSNPHDKSNKWST